MKGYRTLITNLLAIVFALLASNGLDVSPEEQEIITQAVIVIVGLATSNIGLRFVTDTPIGNRK